MLLPFYGHNLCFVYFYLMQSYCTTAYHPKNCVFFALGYDYNRAICMASGWTPVMRVVTVMATVRCFVAKLIHLSHIVNEKKRAFVGIRHQLT
jgi:hypothetical protein